MARLTSSLSAYLMTTWRMGSCFANTATPRTALVWILRWLKDESSLSTRIRVRSTYSRSFSIVAPVDSALEPGPTR